MAFLVPVNSIDVKTVYGNTLPSPQIWLVIFSLWFCIICITKFSYFFTTLIDNNTALHSFYSPETLYCHLLSIVGSPGPISGPRCLLFVSGSACLCCIIWTTLWFPLTASRQPSLECYKCYKKCYAPETRTRDQECTQNTNLDQQNR